MDQQYADLLKTVVTVIGGGILTLVGQFILSHYSYKTKELEIEHQEIITTDTHTSLLMEREPVFYLMGHSLFSELDNCEMFFLTRFKLKDPVRTQIVVEITVHKIRIWRAALIQASMQLQDYLSKHIDEDNRAYVQKVFCDMYNATMVEYVSWHTKPGALSVDGKHVYDTGSIATMELALSRFKIEHSAAETIVWVATNDIAESNTYDDEDFRRCWDIMTIYMFAFVQMKIDSERTMTYFNGSLTGKPFLNGTTVGPM